MKPGDFTALFDELTPINPAVLENTKTVDIAGVTSDSRKAKPGWVFVALIGSHADGHNYIESAVDNGASAVVIDESRKSRVSLPDNVPVFSAPNTYKAFAALSSELAGNPGRKMKMIGVTGTNGKTTVTHLIETMLRKQGKKVGLIGTLGTKAVKSDGYDKTGHTTPMADELQEILAGMAGDGIEYVVMEVSSHALEQYRVYGCDFEVAVLTNVTQDHLDYHQTMDRYWRAKALLFEQLEPDKGSRAAVINLDSDYAQGFVSACPDGTELYSYALKDSAARIRPENAGYTIQGASFTVSTPEGSAPVNLKIAGEFSVYNALAAIAAGLAMKIPLKDCIDAIEDVSGIRGRFEVVAEKPYVIVDYAHTPDGLANVLSAARLVTPEGGRLISVFGCGGDRDATKRPKMGHISETLSDVLVITSDNPRTEDPQQIIADILSGIQHFDSQRMVVNADRKRAIHQAIDLANGNDLIVVAGKGHEDYQILADRTIHFDDREVVQNYMKERGNMASV